MPDVRETPLIVQRQYDLQYDVLTHLLSLSDDVTSDETLRLKIVELKRLSAEIQSAPQEAFALPAPQADQGDDFWGQVWRELVERSVDYALGWTQPGRNVSLYNATGNAIFVRTFDERDWLRWIPYGSWTIQPRNYETVAARGTSNIQVDIGGRNFRCNIGAPYAYDGNVVVQRP